jgi:hypothetical protein
MTGASSSAGHRRTARSATEGIRSRSGVVSKLRLPPSLRPKPTLMPAPSRRIEKPEWWSMMKGVSIGIRVPSIAAVMNMHRRSG